MGYTLTGISREMINNLKEWTYNGLPITIPPLEQVTATGSTIIAADDIPIARFVAYDKAVCGFDAKALGVTAAAATSGDESAIYTTGVVPVEVAEAITIGVEIASDSIGRAAYATLDSKVNGYAVTGGSTGTILVKLA
jgi:hypothetical protein